MGEKFQHRMFVVKITVELQILALTMLVCALNIYILYIYIYLEHTQVFKKTKTDCLIFANGKTIGQFEGP